MRANNNVQQYLDHNNLYFISDKLYSAVATVWWYL